ncbi:MAG: hypothetical protein WAZ18_01690 [Alphaproteobacteria bacterium]
MLETIKHSSVSEIYRHAINASFTGKKRKIISRKNPAKIMDWRNAFMRSRRTQKQKECLLAIYKYMDFGPASGRIKMQTIAKELGITRRSAFARVEAVKNAGWIQVSPTRKANGFQGANIFIASFPVYPEPDAHSDKPHVTEITSSRSVPLQKVTDAIYLSSFNKNKCLTARMRKRCKLAISSKEVTEPSTCPTPKPAILLPVVNLPVDLYPPTSPLNGGEGYMAHQNRPQDFSGFTERAIYESKHKNGIITYSVNEEGEIVEEEIKTKPLPESTQKAVDATHREKTLSNGRLNDAVLAAWQEGYARAFPYETYFAPKVGHLHGWVKTLRRMELPRDKALAFTTWIAYSWAGLQKASFKRLHNMPTLPSLGFACALAEPLYDKFMNPKMFINKFLAATSGDDFERYKYHLIAHGVPEAEAEKIANRKYSEQNFSRKMREAAKRDEKKIATAKAQTEDFDAMMKYFDKFVKAYRARKWFGNPNEVAADLEAVCTMWEAVGGTPTRHTYRNPTQTHAHSVTPQGNALQPNRTNPSEPEEWWYEGMSEDEIRADKERLAKFEREMKEIRSQKFED